jgi:hypothetical protein
MKDLYAGHFTLVEDVPILAVGQRSGDDVMALVRPAYPAKRAVFSIWADVPEGGVCKLVATFELATGRHTSRYTMIEMVGSQRFKSTLNQECEEGRVNEDEFRSEWPIHTIGLRIRASAGVVVKAVGVTYYDVPSMVPAELSQKRGIQEIGVPLYSQRDEPLEVQRYTCCPTAVAMVVAREQPGFSPMQAINLCRDLTPQSYGTSYGNWTGAALVLSRMLSRFHGVVSMPDISYLEHEVSQGRAPIVTLQWSEGELPGAPIPQSGGHLVVVRGFTPGGGIVVNDPAFTRAQGIRRVYPRHAFASCWAKKGNITITSIG